MEIQGERRDHDYIVQTVYVTDAGNVVPENLVETQAQHKDETLERREEKPNHVVPNSDETTERKQEKLRPLVRVIPVAKKPNAVSGVSQQNKPSVPPMENTIIIRTRAKTESPTKTFVTHTGQKFHLCTKCNKAFTTEKVLADHMQDTHGESECGICQKTFGNEGLLNAHLVSHCGLNPPTCVFCDKQLKALSDLKRHLTNFSHNPNHRQKDKVEFECEICGKILASKASYEVHMRRERNELPFKCQVCGKGLADNRSLKVHMQYQHDNVRPHQCATCGKAFKTKPHLEQHYMLHKEEKNFQCTTCMKEFRWQQDLVKHSWVHSDEKPYVCKLCNKGFIRRLYLKTHLTKRHPDYQFTDNDLMKQVIRNSVNNSALNDSVTVQRITPEVKPIVAQDHVVFTQEATEEIAEDVYVEQELEMVSEEIEQSDQTDEMNNIQIEIPGNITIIIDNSENQQHQFTTTEEEIQVDTEQQLVMKRDPEEVEEEEVEETYETIEDQEINEQTVLTYTTNEPRETDECLEEEISNSIITHTGKKFQLCNTCNMAFPSDSLLNLHMMSVHGQRRRFKCDLCSKTFLRKMSLKNHLMVHTNERPYQCTVCHRSFRRITNLNEHFQTHSEAKPYHCSTCGRGFRRKIQLTEHLPQHTGEKPYQCTLCPDRFARKQGLKHHLIRHSGVKPHQCTLCGRTFTIIQNLTQHLQSKHKMKTPHTCASCGQSFAQQTQLQQHLKQHFEGKGFVCEVCNKIFQTEDTLKRHTSTHITEKQHKCALCEKRYVHKGDLRKHVRRDHLKTLVTN